MFNSSLSAVTPSSMFNSVAVEVIVVPSICKTELALIFGDVTVPVNVGEAKGAYPAVANV